MPTAWRAVRRTLAFDLAVLFRELPPYLGVLSAGVSSLIFNSEINAKGESLYILQSCHFASEF